VHRKLFTKDSSYDHARSSFGGEGGSGSASGSFFLDDSTELLFDEPNGAYFNRSCSNDGDDTARFDGLTFPAMPDALSITLNVESFLLSPLNCLRFSEADLIDAVIKQGARTQDPFGIQAQFDLRDLNTRNATIDQLSLPQHNGAVVNNGDGSWSVWPDSGPATKLNLYFLLSADHINIAVDIRLTKSSPSSF